MVPANDTLEATLDAPVEPPLAPPPTTTRLRVPERAPRLRLAPLADSPVAAAAKRAIDVVGSLTLLVLVLPLLLATALAIKVSSPGPVLHRQVRIGRGGRPFTMLKLRTMHLDAEERLRQDPYLHERWLEHGCKLPADEDPRIHGAGYSLRRTSLDELPQLLNVLRGDMSLVGPRPVQPLELDRHYRARGLEEHYCSCRPGLTGLWQVSGRSTVSYPEKANLDARYVSEWRLHRDLAILVKTVPTVLRGTGAH